MTDFSTFYTISEVNLEDQEYQLVEDARALYIRNGLKTPDDCGMLMQHLRNSLASEQGWTPSKNITLKISTMGKHAHYDVALFEEDEPCIYMYIEGWGPNPLVLPQNVLHVLGAKLDPNSISRKMYELYNEESADNAIDQDMLYSEMLTLLDLCADVKTVLSLQTHPCQFVDGTPFLSLVLESAEFKDLVVIPLDIFTMITVLHESNNPTT